MAAKSGACMNGALHYCVALHAFTHVGLHLCKDGVLPTHMRVCQWELADAAMRACAYARSMRVESRTLTNDKLGFDPV